MDTMEAQTKKDMFVGNGAHCPDGLSIGHRSVYISYAQGQALTSLKLLQMSSSLGGQSEPSRCPIEPRK